MASKTSKGESVPRSFWFDPRFAIGIALVVASVLGVLAIVSAADSGVRVYVARSALSPGDRVTSDDLDARSVRLGSTGSRYVIEGGLPGGGLVVTRAISAGELVPQSAVGDLIGTRLAPIVVSVSGQLPKSVTAGAVIDLWSARVNDNVFGAPVVLVSSATVVRVIAKQGIIADRAGESVEVLVPRAKTAKVLEAIANQDAISVVPVDIPMRG
jgi:hypothetical protein